MFSFKFQTKPITITKPTTNIVKATSVNKEQVELELKRLREIEENKKSKEIKRQKELEKKANEAKKKRIADENKLKKIEKERKELEKKQKEEKQRAEEAERKRKADEEKKLKEKALQDEIEAEQLEYDKREILKYTSEIIKSIENRFNRTNLKEGLSCKILIRMIEGGKIIEANIVESSGNELFDQRAEKAVYSASPLPVPTDEKLFNKMRAIRITFDP